MANSKAIVSWEYELKFIRYFKDVLTFNQLSEADNNICFYCEGENYWPHLKPIVESILALTPKKINYVTSEECDPALTMNHPNLQTFVIGSGFIRNYFFDNLQSKIVIMTMPDLDQYQIKKSKKVSHYVYVHHSLVSHHMVYRPKAFDAFDVIFCVGPHHNAEITAMHKAFNMPGKKLVNHGYGRLDSIILNQQEKPQNEIKKILIAPSWGENGTLELMGERLVDQLMELPYEVILRPHPQSLKLAKKSIAQIVEKFKNHERFVFEYGVASEASLHQSDLMISDWSGAAMEYAFGLLKPVLFIDVPKKVQNSSFQQLSIEPFESAIRSQIGHIQSMDLTDLNEQVSALLNSDKDWASHLKSLREQHVYNIGTSGKVAAEAILELL